MITNKTDVVRQVKDNLIYKITETLAIPGSSKLSPEHLVHELRKSIKMIRAMLRLIKPGISQKKYDKIDLSLSKSSKSLAIQREATINMKTFLHLTGIVKETFPESIRLTGLQELSDHQKSAYSNVNGQFDNKITGVCFQLNKIRSSLDKMEYSDFQSTLLQKTLEKTYLKARSLYMGAKYSLSTEMIHNWRKHSKLFLFQLKYGPVTDTRSLGLVIKKLDSVSEALGKEHDLAILKVFLKKKLKLNDDEESFINRVIERERMKWQKKAYFIGNQLFSNEKFDIQSHLAKSL